MKPVTTGWEIWVRDNVQGLGTITFLTEQSRFGALGHGISDTDTNMLIDRLPEGGSIVQVFRISQKATAGHRVQWRESLYITNIISWVRSTKIQMREFTEPLIRSMNFLMNRFLLKQRQKTRLKSGDAKIRCYIDNEIKEYNIRVTDIDTTSSEINKGLVIQVTDPELLEKNRRYHPGNERQSDHSERETDRSGNTCVRAGFDNGLCIFIENMLNQVESSETSKIVSN